MKAVRTLACTQSLAISLLRTTGVNNPLLAQVVILAGKKLAVAGTRVNEVIDQSSFRHLAAFLEHPQFDTDGYLAINSQQSKEIAELSIQLIGSNNGVREIVRAMAEVVVTQFSALSCYFGPFGVPINSIAQMETRGANPHCVFRVDRPEAGSVFLKDAPMEVEQYGIKLVGLVGIKQYRVLQVGEWGVIEPLFGVTIDKIEQSAEVMQKIGFGCGRYFAAAWAFGIVERDEDACNILIDPTTFETRHIDFEVILCPLHASEPGIADDVYNVLKFCRREFAAGFLLNLIDGFAQGCKMIQQKQREARQIVKEAFENKVAIGFTGHEPAGALDIRITGQRRPLPLRPDDQRIIEERLKELADGNEAVWTEIIGGILDKIPQRRLF